MIILLYLFLTASKWILNLYFSKQLNHCRFFPTKSNPYWKLKFIPVFAKALSHSERLITQKRDSLQGRKYFLQAWKSASKEYFFSSQKGSKQNLHRPSHTMSKWSPQKRDSLQERWKIIGNVEYSNLWIKICTGFISCFNNTFVCK